VKADEAVFLRGPHGWLEARGPRRAHIVAALAGLIANLGFAPFYFFPAAAAGWIALIWLLDGAARRERPMRAAFWRTFTFGCGYFLAGLYWVFFAFMNVDGAAPLAVPGVIALTCGMALFWAVAAAIAIRFWSTGPKRLAVFVLAIMTTEWARGHLFGGFPWNLPGYVWPAGGEMSQAASVVGIYGLSAFTLLTLVAPATLADAGRFGFRVAPSLVAAVALGALWGAGGQRLAAPLPPAPGVIVRVADAGFSQRAKWKPGNELAVYQRYAALLDRPGPSKADVDIWPESAMPFLLLDQPELLADLGARLGDRVLVTGASRAETHAGKTLYYNSGVVLDGVAGSLRVGQIYNKSRLVPFGEFIPLWSTIEPIAGGLHLKALQEIGSGFEPGEPPQRIVIPGAGDAAILICYEVIFPGFAPRGGERPAWLINLTNDAWYGAQTGPYEHFNQARYRSIEEGLPMARAASGGVSAIVDPYGRTVVETGLDGGAAEAPLPAALPPTLFASHNGIISGVVFLLLAGLGIGLPRGQASGRNEEAK
jgi:apolipoprotein N-acyltransferase